MARIRSVKPELRRDLTVAAWPRDCRYAWVLLWGYLDDHGRGLDDLRLLVADLFPLDRDVTQKRLDAWLTMMAARNPHSEPPLCRYQVDGRSYLHAPKWRRAQRVSHPQQSKLPPCPVHEANQNGSGTPSEPRANGSGAHREPFRTSRTPEGLGVKGARDQGVKGARVPEAVGGAEAVPNGAHTPDPAEELVDDGPPLVPAIRRQLLEQVRLLLAGHVPVGAIRGGLTEWRRRQDAPGLLPHLVQDQLNATTGGRAGGKTRSTSDDRAQQALDAGERVQRRHEEMTR